MSEALDLTLDHVGVAIRDLEAGRVAYDKLGFQLTPRSMHSGSETPGAPVTPWGSGNHCAMFQTGYLEIVGLVDPNMFSSTKALVERYEGAHIVAFRCPDATTAHAALVANGVPAQEARALERDAAFGPDGAETRRAAFRNIYLDGAAYPDAKFIVIEHGTPDVLWQPHQLAHPNGAVAISAVVLCATDVEASAARMTKFLGIAPETADSAKRFALRHGTVTVMDPGQVAVAYDGVTPPAMPWVAAFTISVADRGATKALFEKNGVTFTEDPNGLRVGPAQTKGPVIVFA